MISKKEFIQKVKTEFFPKIVLIEEQRKKALLRGVIGSVVIVFIAIGLYLCGPLSADSLRGLIGLVIFGGGWAFSPASNLHQRMKEKWTATLLRFLGDLKNTQNSIDFSLLERSCLFKDLGNVVFDDSISGVFKQTTFSVAEVDVRGQKLFKGLCIDIHIKPVAGYTILCHHTNSRRQKLEALQKVTLESVSFHENYEVYSDNQIEARFLLSPLFMERLNALKKQFQNKEIDVSFFGTHAVFFIHTSEDLFEWYSEWKKVTDITRYEKFYSEIKAIYDTIDVLSINNQSVERTDEFNEEVFKEIVMKQNSKKPNPWFFLLAMGIAVIAFLYGLFASGTWGITFILLVGLFVSFVAIAGFLCSIFLF